MNRHIRLDAVTSMQFSLEGHLIFKTTLFRFDFQVNPRYEKKYTVILSLPLLLLPLTLSAQDKLNICRKI